MSPKEVLTEILSRRVLSVLALVAIIFLTSGGVYVVVEQPGPMAGTSSGGSAFLYPAATAQTSVELIVVFLLTLGGAVGFILLEGALKKTFDPSGAKVKYLLAVGLIVVSVFLIEYLAYIKV